MLKLWDKVRVIDWGFQNGLEGEIMEIRNSYFVHNEYDLSWPWLWGDFYFNEKDIELVWKET